MRARLPVLRRTPVAPPDGGAAAPAPAEILYTGQYSSGDVWRGALDWSERSVIRDTIYRPRGMSFVPASVHPSGSAALYVCGFGDGVLYRMAPDGSDLQQLCALDDVQGLHVEPAENAIWLVNGTRTLYRCALDGSGLDALFSSRDAYLKGVTVLRDEELATGGRIYVSGNTGTSRGFYIATIDTFGLDGTGGARIFFDSSGSSFQSVLGMAIDERQRQLFFIEYDGAGLWKAALDGSGAEVVAGFSEGYRVALDRANEVVYMGRRHLDRVSYDGTGYERLAQASDFRGVALAPTP